MAQAKIENDTKTKSVPKANTRFYVVKKVQAARNDLTGKLEDYNLKYIVQPLKSSKTFVKDLKSEPRKIVVTLLDDGKAYITDLNKDAWNRVEGLAKDGQVFFTKAGKNPRETFTDLLDDGKELVEDIRSNTREKIEDLTVDLKILKKGVEKDTRLVMEDIIDGSKNALDRLPGKQWIENEVSNRAKAIPAIFNLPSRKDIERLTRQVKNLNAKVNKLSKTQAV